MPGFGWTLRRIEFLPTTRSATKSTSLVTTSTQRYSRRAANAPPIISNGTNRIPELYESPCRIGEVKLNGL